MGEGAAGLFEHGGEVRPVLCGGLERRDPLTGGDQFGSRVIELALGALNVVLHDLDRRQVARPLGRAAFTKRNFGHSVTFNRSTAVRVPRRLSTTPLLRFTFP